ncbi:phospholipase A and acyltransferase 3-like [Anoplopoma fimbria]|uniref:phospholipase A and acyltransferase 3-like n=1 Tax=Anoplopoma fimbria TaxID=229290 RepID=UPI0023EC0FED|nr:phospholipase A and acyltransferase 3-like [Anoplopoma fimbria]XP_054453719.1 phospholipase A and acyltransferase 3-like [Anoplopoma fimbria]
MAPTLYDEKPDPGDLIEIFRGSYQHWAVYVGDGFVVHLAPPSEVPGSSANSMMSVLAEKALVKKEELWDVVGTNQWKINNSQDKKHKPRCARVIVREACAMVGQELPYCVFRGNCEHFVNELRYGKAESQQVCKARDTALIAGVAGAVLMGAVYLFGGSKKENKNKE